MDQYLKLTFRTSGLRDTNCNMYLKTATSFFSNSLFSLLKKIQGLFKNSLLDAIFLVIRLSICFEVHLDIIFNIFHKLIPQDFH